MRMLLLILTAKKNAEFQLDNSVTFLVSLICIWLFEPHKIQSATTGLTEVLSATTKWFKKGKRVTCKACPIRIRLIAMKSQDMEMALLLLISLKFFIWKWLSWQKIPSFFRDFTNVTLVGLAGWLEATDRLSDRGDKLLSLLALLSLAQLFSLLLLTRPPRPILASCTSSS